MIELLEHPRLLFWLKSYFGVKSNFGESIFHRTPVYNLLRVSVTPASQLSALMFYNTTYVNDKVS
jgi:hypothetical protein